MADAEASKILQNEFINLLKQMLSEFSTNKTRALSLYALEGLREGAANNYTIPLQGIKRLAKSVLTKLDEELYGELQIIYLTNFKSNNINNKSESNHDFNINKSDMSVKSQSNLEQITQIGMETLKQTQILHPNNNDILNLTNKLQTSLHDLSKNDAVSKSHLTEILNVTHQIQDGLQSELQASQPGQVSQFNTEERCTRDHINRDNTDKEASPQDRCRCTCIFQGAYVVDIIGKDPEENYHPKKQKERCIQVEVNTEPKEIESLEIELGTEMKENIKLNQIKDQSCKKYSLVNRLSLDNISYKQGINELEQNKAQVIDDKEYLKSKLNLLETNIKKNQEVLIKVIENINKEISLVLKAMQQFQNFVDPQFKESKFSEEFSKVKDSLERSSRRVTSLAEELQPVGHRVESPQDEVEFELSMRVRGPRGRPEYPFNNVELDEDGRFNLSFNQQSYVKQ